ncbi:MAG TPA: SufD family Fe-S cluster assembly protein, partial [Candidatus Nitrosopelagicus sp.]|nr:SufD family Fe-S cluster assembly protein [Candidatus Nitrosopelagicus sp.]
IGENSKLDFTTLQIMDQSVVNFSTRSTYLAQDAKINWYLGLFGSMLSRYRIGYHLNGTGAVVNDAEVVFGNNDQSFDLNTIVNHNAQSTEGKVVEKSILKDTSKSLFKGMIRINEQAAHSNSFLSGRSILLSKGAKSDSIPGLEIFTNDVKATHSASVAQVDDEQIFYLGTRCLSHSEAERIIVEGFLEPMSRIMSYQVRAWLANIIESKWMNKELTINMDEHLKSIVEVEEVRYNENEEVEQHYKYR